jgi:hypothetical protein
VTETPVKHSPVFLFSTKEVRQRAFMEILASRKQGMFVQIYSSRKQGHWKKDMA